MNRYRSYGDRDDQPQVVGDGAFKGVDEYNAVENIAEGEVQQAVNTDFTSQDAVTRGGFVCLPETSRLSNPLTQTLLQTSAAPWSSSANISAVLFGNGYYLVAVSSTVAGVTTSYVYQSYDLNSFTLLSTFVNIQVSSGIFNSGRFFLIGSDLSVGVVAYASYSTDGTTWTSVSGLPAGLVNLVAITKAFNTLVISGTTAADQYIIKSSDNGDTWVSNTINYTIRSLAYANGVFVAAYSNAVTFLPNIAGSIYSYDAETWYQSDLPITSRQNSQAPTIAFGNNMFLCIHQRRTSAAFPAPQIYRSYDGITWSSVLTLPFEGALGAVISWKFFSFYQGFFILFFGYDLDTASPKYQILTTISGESLTTRYSYLTSSTDINTPRLYSVPYPPDPGSGAKYIVDNFTWDGSAQVRRFFNLLNPVSVYASTIYTDPDQPGDQWIAVVGSDSVGFYASGRSTRRISLNGLYVTEQSTIVQCNNLVYIFRGPDVTPLYWDGNWSSTFQLAPTPTPASGFQIIPNSNQATYYQNRLWVKKGKDEILASDILDFNTYETITNSFNLNTGSSDYVVATFPFGDKTLLVFKNKSILALNNVDGSLADVTATEVTRQVGLVGIRAITSVGPDLAYVSYKNVNLITLTATNNSVQHKTLPLSFKIKKIMNRVNWEYAYKISLGYADNKLYVALPLDNSVFCNAVAVYNFVTGQWYGEWNFDGAMNMCIQDFQVANYIGLQKVHAVTEDGRIFVMEEGNTDITNFFGNTSTSTYVDSSIEISTKLVTRAYDTAGLNHYQRRMFMDLATLRPSFSVVAYTEGASESTTLITDQTYSRSESWKFNDTPYDLTNVNNDYNRAYRKDYSTGATSIQPQSGFEPEMLQEFRLPLMTTRQGRLSWLEITNTQGTISIMSAGFETRPGQRSNLVQV